MSSHDDEFDLDVRLSSSAFHPGLFAGDPEPGPETVAPQATCPANTCELGCQTDLCDTAGCNTSETCQNPLCGSDAITFGRYCEDQSDDTCNACPGPETGAGCIDPPDTVPPC